MLRLAVLEGLYSGCRLKITKALWRRVWLGALGIWVGSHGDSPWLPLWRIGTFKTSGALQLMSRAPATVPFIFWGPVTLVSRPKPQNPNPEQRFQHPTTLNPDTLTLKPESPTGSTLRLATKHYKPNRNFTR